MLLKSVRTLEHHKSLRRECAHGVPMGRGLNTIRLSCQQHEAHSNRNLNFQCSGFDAAVKRTSYAMLRGRLLALMRAGSFDGARKLYLEYDASGSRSVAYLGFGSSEDPCCIAFCGAYSWYGCALRRSSSSARCHYDFCKEPDHPELPQLPWSHKVYRSLALIKPWLVFDDRFIPPLHSRLVARPPPSKVLDPLMGSGVAFVHGPGG